MLARTVFEFKTDVLSLDTIPIHSGYLPPSEGLIAEVMNPTITVSHSARIDWASKVMVVMLESTTHKSTGRLIYTVLSVQCPVSLSFLICVVLSSTLPKHTLITDLCSWYSHPLARKRSGSVICLIQSVFIYVITAASTMKLSLSFLSSQKSPYSVERDWECNVCQFCLGEKHKLLKKPSPSL